MAEPAIDEAARQAISRHLHQTLFVEAGAGSGKTTELVHRLVNLVSDGQAAVDELAAITFTDAAAAELRARVREALEDAEQRAASEHDRRARCREALNRLDEAAILTLHSFAQRILARFPVEAGLPPAVEVADEVASVLGFEERWQETVRRLLDDDELEPVVHAALALGLDLHSFEGVARHFNQNWDLVEDMSLDLALPTIALDLHEPLGHYRAALAAGARADPPADDTLAVRLAEQVAPWVRRAEVATDLFELFELVQAPPKVGRNLGRKQHWRDLKAEVVERGGAGQEAATAICDRMQHEVISAIGSRIAVSVLEQARTRCESGQLEFHDLLVLARRLVRHDPPVQQWLHHRYRALLIDEFQDTDPIQAELAVRIAAPEHQPEADWTEIEVPAGRLFFVGDPKQSIYRFRRADIAVFNRVKERFAAAPTELVVSFRSVPGIVDVVNGVFSAAMEEGADQVAFAALHAARPPLPASGGPAVARFGEPAPEARAEPLRHDEAAGAARAIRQALDEGWLVHDGESTRPIAPSDIAVLIPARTSLPHLEGALDTADIPYRLETGTLVYGTEEIADLISVLTAIADPADQVALAGALRSPAYGCGDDDLFTWRQGGGAWSYLVAPPAGLQDHPVAGALADLRQRHDRHIWQSVPEIVHEVIRERRLMEVVLVGERAPDAWRRFRVVIEHARQHADAGAGHLREFLTWARLQSSDTIRPSVPILPERDLDAVRIMTIHGAKGLEFPMVVVSGLTTGQSSGPPGPQVHLDAGGFHIRIRSGAQTGAFDTQRAAEDQMDAAERLRLLYVALTRARDHLVVSTHHKPKQSGAISSHGHLLWEHLHRRPDVAVVDPQPLTHRAAQPEPTREPAPPPLSEVRACIEHRERAWRSPVGLGVVAATAVAGLGAVDAPEPDRREEPAGPPWRRGRAGTAVGRATHAVLQHAELDGADGTAIAALARHHAALEGVAPAAGEVEAKARAALAHPLVREAARARHWREVPVAAPIGPTVLEGFVDLLYETPDGLVVVDHKTDAVRSEAELHAALERYVPQGAAYALALETATGRPVARVAFLFLRAGEAVALDVPDLEAEVAAVRSTILAAAET